MHPMDTGHGQGLDEVIRVRVDADMRRRFRAHARAEARTESSQARLLIREYIEKRDAA